MADAVSKAAPQLPSDNANSSKFFSHFMSKAALVTIFLVLLPLFPSLAPDFINQTLHARSWELLQLIFVGIAVSYGLFSKKNDEMEKDYHSSKIDSAQSYVSKLLQVSSVFDDESENQTVIEENKFQTLNSQYYKGEPVVVVAKESPVVKEENGVVSEISRKPLLLPVRSLKQRVPCPNEVDLGNESREKNASRSSSRSGSKRFSSNSRKSRNVEVGGLNVEKLEEKVEENIVLRSPIPWRSRSGRMMEMKENGDDSFSFTVSPSMEEPELKSVESSRSFRPSRLNLSPKNLSPSSSVSTSKLSPSTSFSSESQAKSGEDVVRKKGFSSPPPAPPPPPGPRFLRKSVLMKSNSSVVNNADSPEKVLRRSVRSVPADELSDSEMEELPRRMNPGSELRGQIQNDGLVNSVRRFRPSELVMGAEKESNGYEMKFAEEKGPNEAMQGYPKFPKEEKNEFIEKVLVETTDDEESEAETEDDHFEGSSGNTDQASTDNNVNDAGPDVDKKADEFIAKFREQIRLQRIESIRRSTAQRAGKNLR